MDYVLYSVRDRVSSQFSLPMAFVNDDDMRRRIAVAYKDNPFIADLELYKLGSFDCLRGYLIVAQEDFNVFVDNVSAIVKEYLSSEEA